MGAAAMKTPETWNLSQVITVWQVLVSPAVKGIELSGVRRGVAW